MSETNYNNVFDYIIAEEAAYRTNRVPLTDGWEWNMYEHIRKSFLYKHSKFSKGADDGSRPNKNIIRPILNVAYRSEGFDVKDITPFVNDDQNYHKSFLVKKYHPRWARENDIDTAIDESVESYVDYGLALLKNVNDVRPEVVPLQRIAFCDQTDILSGPICEKHQYSPDQLLEMAGKWDKDKIEEAITMARSEKVTIGTDGKAKTPGKYIEVYELHGTLPTDWLGDEENAEEGEYAPQLHIVTYYTSQDNKKTGIHLFKGKESKPRYKAIVRDKVFGRACGYGGVEELFEAQTWTNYSEIKLKEMIDAASLAIWVTNDQAFAQRNKVSDLATNEILYLEEGKDLIPKTPNLANKVLFDRSVNEWEQHAMTMGSASEGSLGKNPSAGTPFKLQDLVVQEGKGLHEYRQGKLATFWGEVYRDWELPHMVKKLNQGTKWLDELSLDELQDIADKISTQRANQRVKEIVLKGEVVTKEEADTLRETFKTEFLKGGSKRFLQMMRDDLKDLPIDVEMNIAGKQKDLAKNADKLTNVFRQIFANPQVLRDPGMAKLFNQIIESSGFSPIDFTSFTQALPQPMTEQVNQMQPMEQMEELAINQ